MAAPKECVWYVYLLSNGTRSYVGMTNQPLRRLRQHNGEIKGGASSTSRSLRPWFFVGLLVGFEGRGQALTWEALIKKRCRGLASRLEAMRGVAEGRCPPGKKYFRPPTVIFLADISSI